MCANDYLIQRLPRYHLSCGHSYCPHALRELKRSANEHGWSKSYCCGRLVPAALFDAAAIAEEEEESRGTGVWDDTASMSSSLNAKAGAISRIPEPRLRPRPVKRRHTTLSEQSTVLAAHEARMNLAKVLEIPDFRLLHVKHRTQRDRFVAWDQQCRTALVGTYTKRKDDIKKEHECLQERLSDEVSHLQNSRSYFVLTVNIACRGSFQSRRSTRNGRSQSKDRAADRATKHCNGAQAYGGILSRRIE